MNSTTNIKPIINDIIPASIESCPRSGPTVLSSIMLRGAGKAPDLNNKAKSVADWNVKSPDIWPDPPIIGSLTDGALIILPSSIIASLFPTPVLVAFPNFFAPTLSKVKDTTVSLVWEFIDGFASTKLSPLKIIRLLTIAFSEPSSNSNFSVPKDSSVFWVINWKVKLAVFPNKDFILPGSSKPGNSTKILSFPLFKIFGSLVPTSSTLLLTISIAWSKEAFFNRTSPYLERVNLKESWFFTKSNSCDLYCW